MDADEAQANFSAITGATNAAAITGFLERFQNNLEMAIESFFEVLDTCKKPPPRRASLNFFL